jgi:hypothetical protein
MNTIQLHRNTHVQACSYPIRFLSFFQFNFLKLLLLFILWMLWWLPTLVRVNYTICFVSLLCADVYSSPLKYSAHTLYLVRVRPLVFVAETPLSEKARRKMTWTNTINKSYTPTTAVSSLISVSASNRFRSLQAILFFIYMLWTRAVFL